MSLLITIKDAFGDDVLVSESKMTIDFEPHAQTSANPFFYWEDDPYFPDSPYRKIIGPVSDHTAKTDVAVKKILYADDSVDSF